MPDRKRVNKGVPAGGQFALERKRANISFQGSIPSSVIDDWKNEGFTEAAAIRWITADIGIETAIEWRADGVSVDDASTLRNIHTEVAIQWMDEGMSAKEIATYNEYGLSLQTALKWHLSNFAVEEAKAWLDCGVTPEEASQLRFSVHHPSELREWIEAGYDIESAADMCRDGLKLNDVLLMWSNHGLNDVDRFFFAQLGINDPQEAAEWRELEDSDYITATFAPLGLSPEEMKSWQDSAVPSAHYYDWINSGMEPEEAADWERFQLTPADYKTWQSYCSDPQDVFSCLELGLKTPERAAREIPRNMPPREALIWQQCGISLENISDWQESGFDATDADLWNSAGYTPEGARMRVLDGYNDPLSADD